MYRFVSTILVIVILSLANGVSEAHFFGATKNVGNYQTIFQSVPEIPSPGENTFLNFSLLDLNANNVYNLMLSIEIKEGENTVHAFPEKWYEFSDISQEYVFPEEGIYKIIYSVKVAGDDNPIMVEYDLVVRSAGVVDWQIIGITAAVAIPVAIIGWLRVRRRK